MAFDLFRMPEHVADVLATQVFHQKPEGHYIQECGLPDQGGQVLPLATHYLVTKDADWMKKNSEPLIQGGTSFLVSTSASLLPNRSVIDSSGH